MSFSGESFAAFPAMGCSTRKARLSQAKGYIMRGLQ
jgi:hypothetical protein